MIVAPSTPIGPRDIKPTPTGRIIVEAATGKMPAFVDTGLNLVHVDDVAQGHLAALDRGKIGENYILGGEDVSLQTMLGDIAALSGRRAPRVKLPRAPLVSPGLGGGSAGPDHRQGAVAHRRRAAHVALSHVLQLGKGET